jgi:hypothetical protein
MSIDVNVYLRNKGGKTSRAQGKLSTKETHNNKKGGTSAVATKKNVNHMGALATFMASGSMMKSAIMKVPVLRSAMIAGKVADKGVNFVTNIYQARSGERMVSNNIRAYSKVASTLGIAYIEGAIDNWLYREPEVQRQNYMLDYGRELFTRNIENEKNKFS